MESLGSRYIENYTNKNETIIKLLTLGKTRLCTRKAVNYNSLPGSEGIYIIII